MKKNKILYLIVFLVIVVIISIVLFQPAEKADKPPEKIEKNISDNNKGTDENLPQSQPIKLYTYLYEYDVPPEHYMEYIMIRENGEAYIISIHGGHEPLRDDGTIYKVKDGVFELEVDGRAYKVKTVEAGIEVTGFFLKRSDGTSGIEKRVYVHSEYKGGE